MSGKPMGEVWWGENWKNAVKFNDDDVSSKAQRRVLALGIRKILNAIGHLQPQEVGEVVDCGAKCGDQAWVQPKGSPHTMNVHCALPYPHNPGEEKHRDLEREYEWGDDGVVAWTSKIPNITGFCSTHSDYVPDCNDCNKRLRLGFLPTMDELVSISRAFVDHIRSTHLNGKYDESCVYCGIMADFLAGLRKK